jgi:hypothetical protein
MFRADYFNDKKNPLEKPLKCKMYLSFNRFCVGVRVPLERMSNAWLG